MHKALSGQPTFADRIIQFNRSLNPRLSLPEGIAIMNPFRDNPRALEISSQFYKKYYNDNNTRKLILGIDTSVAFCLGSGKNYQVLSRMNEEHGFFEKLIPLEHPRFIMQYRSKQKQQYIQKYLDALNE